MSLMPILSEGVEPVLYIIEWISLGIEVLAISLICIGVFTSTGRYFYGMFKNTPAKLARYTIYRHSLARTLMLGLEILVAADIVRTVALEPTFKSVSVLGLLVLIRIILGWSLMVEIEGRWPWQPEHKLEETDL